MKLTALSKLSRNNKTKRISQTQKFTTDFSTVILMINIRTTLDGIDGRVRVKALDGNVNQRDLKFRIIFYACR